MHDKRKFLAIIGMLTCLCGALGASAPSMADYGAFAYHYCYASEGETYYFSEIFTLETGKWDQGAENSFHSFVTGRLADGPLDHWQCMGPYETATEAEDKMNDHIGERRRDGDDVVLTRWRYHGD